MSGEDSVGAVARIKKASDELHHSYAINWTTALMALGMTLMLQVFAIAARYEYRQGGFTESAFNTFHNLVLFGQVVVFAFWLSLCLLAWMGPEVRDDG